MRQLRLESDGVVYMQIKDNTLGYGINMVQARFHLGWAKQATVT